MAYTVSFVRLGGEMKALRGRSKAVQAQAGCFAGVAPAAPLKAGEERSRGWGLLQLLSAPSAGGLA